MELIRRLPRRLSKNGKRLISWGLYQCPNSVCNKQVERQLSNGKIAKSCGCMKNKILSQARTIHGYKGTRLYNIWAHIKQRVLNPNNKDYPNYGGRGITICNEWLEFTPFRDWALSNEYSDNLVIDREDPNGNYEPSNCRWVTIEESNRNRTNTITMKIANEIRDLDSTGNYTQKELALLYKMSPQNISRIIKKQRWWDNE